MSGNQSADIDDRKEKIRAAVKDHNSRAHIALVASWSEAIARSVPVVDRFATWFLAIVGASVGLTIANLSQLVGVTNESSAKIFVLLSVFSGLLGIASKIYAMVVGQLLAFGDEFNKIIMPRIQEFDKEGKELHHYAREAEVEIKLEVDFLTALEDLLSDLPRWVRKRRISLAQDLVNNPLKIFQSVARVCIYQQTYILIAVILYLLALFILGLSM